MATEIRVPTLGKSVAEATVGQWFKQAGNSVTADEPLVELETDKVTVEVPAPASGVLAEIAVKAGDTVAVGAVLGAIRDADGTQPPAKTRGETKSAAAPIKEVAASFCHQAEARAQALPTRGSERGGDALLARRAQAVGRERTCRQGRSRHRPAWAGAQAGHCGEDTGTLGRGRRWPCG